MFSGKLNGQININPLDLIMYKVDQSSNDFCVNACESQEYASNYLLSHTLPYDDTLVSSSSCASTRWFKTLFRGNSENGFLGIMRVKGLIFYGPNPNIH